MENAVVFIPATVGKMKNYRILIEYAFQYLPCKKIIICGNTAVKDYIEEDKRVSFLDEDTLYPGLSFQAVKDELVKISAESSQRAGWYLQQFLKMAFSFITSEDTYIVWDVDSLPLHEIPYWDEQGKLYFTMKSEYHKPYFNTMEKLFNGEISRVAHGGGSFIAEQMIIKANIMREMIERIGNDDHSFWKHILHACDPKDIWLSGFSEFETYGNYVMSHPVWKNQYCYRKLRHCRRGVCYIGAQPAKEMLDWAAKDLDMISIESSEDPKGLPALFFYLSQNKYFRNWVSITSCMKMRRFLSRIWQFIRRDKAIYDVEID